MNEGVQILLERMKTHPEEFVPETQYSATKWGNIIGQYNEYLTTEESEAIQKAYKATVHQVMRERFTSKVMEELIDPKSEESPREIGVMPLRNTQTNYTLQAGQHSPTWANTGNVTLNANSMTLGKTELDEETLKHMKEHLKAINAKERETIVGQLHNYLHEKP